jgi:hypothetical protein
MRCATHLQLPKMIEHTVAIASHKNSLLIVWRSVYHYTISYRDHGAAQVLAISADVNSQIWKVKQCMLNVNVDA